VLGMKGPSYIMDTACSSALVALDNAAVTVRRTQCTSAINSAANIMASPSTYISFSKPRMLSPTGRCFTFDDSANGYQRGEGGGSAVLGPMPGGDYARAVLRGSAINQDGRSSTLTAPNGPSQQLVMKAALQEAHLTSLEIGHMECHGTGTPLGDPIEVGALHAINAGRDMTSPLVMCAVKSNVGHLEGAAASSGILKTVEILQSHVALAGIHLRALNPDVFVLDMPAKYATELMAFCPRRPSNGSISSFGFGGTNAYAAFSTAPEVLHPPSRVGPMTYQRRPFPWREAGFRFLRQLPSEGVFEVSMRADVYDVVKHHVVFGSIVVPGVVYVEMALQATRKLFGHGAHLTDITMVFPFVIPVRTTGSEPSAIMRFVLRGESRFEIQSTSATGKVTVHAEGGIDKRSKVAESRMVVQDLESFRQRIDEVVDPADVYAAIDGVGLWLGPMFQVAKQLWRKETESSNEVFGKLVLEPGVPNIGYVLHPALFDGTIHTLGTASVGKNVNDLKIFGGVGRVTVLQQENFSQL